MPRRVLPRAARGIRSGGRSAGGPVRDDRRGTVDPVRSSPSSSIDRASNVPGGPILRSLDGLRYTLVPEDRIRDFVVAVCEEEWDEADFPAFGRDLYGSAWRLETVEVGRVRVNATLLARPAFLEELGPRIEVQAALARAGTPIPPLILRGNDRLILDGYARFHAFLRARVARCLAYVGYRR